MQADSNATPKANARRVDNMVKHKALRQVKAAAMPVPVHQCRCPKNALHTA